MTVEVWDAQMASLLDPESELETIELGDRVSWDFTMMLGATIYHDEKDRQRSVVLMLLGQVCQGIRDRCEADDMTDLVPTAWLPSELAHELGRERVTPNEP